MAVFALSVSFDYCVKSNYVAIGIVQTWQGVVKKIVVVKASETSHSHIPADACRDGFFGI